MRADLELLLGVLIDVGGADDAELFDPRRQGHGPSYGRAGPLRRYNADVLQRLRAVQAAQQAGFTLNEIGTLFSGSSEDTPVSTRGREMAVRKIDEVEALITKAQRMRQVLEEGLRCGCVELNDCFPVLGDKSVIH